MSKCFVVMGFGEKTNPDNGRRLNLDATYQNIIKPAVQHSGYECMRADEVLHSGMIDIPMYERLLDADLVIADISTSNLNAMFELGIRHALRPRATIVLAESEFRSPFDVNHIVIHKYQHLGQDIGYAEAMRMREHLEALIAELDRTKRVDSPVYTLLQLDPPVRNERQSGKASRAGKSASSSSVPVEETHAHLWAKVLESKANSRFVEARDLLKEIYQRQVEETDGPPRPRVVQELALMTYKVGESFLSEDVARTASAYNEAVKLLRMLEPDHTTDPETLGLWSAVHKRLAELPGRPKAEVLADLQTAIYAAERGFLIRQDHYSGINLAYLFDRRASLTSGDDQIADRVFAGRVRGRVVAIATQEKTRIEDRMQDPGGDTPQLKDALYWATATIAEAKLGMNDTSWTQVWLEAQQSARHTWMIDATLNQMGKLKELKV